MYRPQDNETIVQPQKHASLTAVLRATQRAIDRVRHYVMNCPIGFYTCRATTYITIQPIVGQLRERVCTHLSDLHAQNACLVRDCDFDGRIQLMLYTPSPSDRIIPCSNQRPSLSLQRARFSHLNVRKC